MRNDRLRARAPGGAELAAFCIATCAWTSSDVKSICVEVRSSANPTTDDRANRGWNTARQRELSATNCNSNDLASQ